jgi:aspartate 1-decarboxylase
VINEQECGEHNPRVVFVDADNRPVELGSDPTHAPEGSGLITPRMLSTLEDAAAQG